MLNEFIFCRDIEYYEIKNMHHTKKLTQQYYRNRQKKCADKLGFYMHNLKSVRIVNVGYGIQILMTFQKIAGVYVFKTKCLHIKKYEHGVLSETTDENKAKYFLTVRNELEKYLRSW